MTKQQKQVYETPTTETLELRFEESLLLEASNTQNSPNSGYDNDWGLGTI